MYSFKKRGGFDPFRPRVLRSWSSDAWQTIQVCDGRLQIGQYWNMGHLNKRSYGSKIPYDIIWWIVFFRYHHSISFYIIPCFSATHQPHSPPVFRRHQPFNPAASQPRANKRGLQQPWAWLEWWFLHHFVPWRGGPTTTWNLKNFKLFGVHHTKSSHKLMKKILSFRHRRAGQTFLWWNGCCILHFLTIIHVTSHNVPVWPGQMNRTP